MLRSRSPADHRTQAPSRAPGRRGRHRRRCSRSDCSRSRSRRAAASRSRSRRCGPWSVIAAVTFVAIPKHELALRIGVLLYGLGSLRRVRVSTPGGQQRRAARPRSSPDRWRPCCGGRRTRAGCSLPSLPLAYLAVAGAGPRRQPLGERPLGASVVLPAAAGVPAPSARAAVPDRDPVHQVPLGGVRRRAVLPAGARLGAPARHQVQPPLLRRHAGRPHLRGVAALAGRPLRRDLRRAARLLGRARRRRSSTAACRTCGSSCAPSTGACTRSATRRRSSRDRRRSRTSARTIADARRPAVPAQCLSASDSRPYWAIEGGSGCVAPDGEFTSVTAAPAGTVRLVIAFSFGRIRADSPRCD